MFVDYLTLMLVNLVAGLFLLAYYVWRGLEDSDQKRWVPAFSIVGMLALVTGLPMIWNWPLPNSHNIAFGEMSVFFGALFLGAALALAKEWNLSILGVYAFFAGAAAVTVGARILNLGMTKEPLLSSIGFILAGLGGMFAAATLCLRANRVLRVLGAVALVLAALIFAFTGYGAYWDHLAGFSKWVPPTMK